jgi:hypothetical protein
MSAQSGMVTFGALGYSSCSDACTAAQQSRFTMSPEAYTNTAETTHQAMKRTVNAAAMTGCRMSVGTVPMTSHATLSVAMAICARTQQNAGQECVSVAAQQRTKKHQRVRMQTLARADAP